MSGVATKTQMSTGAEIFSFVTSGSRGWAKYYSDTGPIFLRMGNLDRGTISLDLADIQHVCPPEGTEGTRTKVQEGDILISITADLGMVGLVPKNLGEAYINQHVALARPTETIEPRYGAWFLASKHAQDQFEENRRGAVKAGLRLDDIRNLRVPLPPLPEQRRIVARIEELFSRLDAGVAALSHAKAQLQRYRQSVLAAAVTGQLTRAWREQHPDTEPASVLLERIREQRREQWCGKGKYSDPAEPELENVPEIPDPWHWTTAEALSDENRAITYGVIKLGVDFEGGIQTLRSSDVRPLRLELDHVKSINPEIAQNYRRTFLKGGELLVTVRGTLGGICVVPDECAGFNISREVALIAPVIREVGPCAALMIASQPLQRWMLGRTKGITYRGVNIETLKRLPIPLPPLVEQHQIVAEVEARTTAIDRLEVELNRQIARSNRLRQSTLRAAFEGKTI